MPPASVLPPFDRVRLATLDDLPRIAIVAAAGFFHSPSFQFQRIHHAEYPDDTLSSYLTEYKNSILDPACVVLVAEDTLRDDESAHVYEALRGATAYNHAYSLRGGNVVVVGISSVAIPSSHFVGQFQAKSRSEISPTLNVSSENLNRDQCPTASKVYSEATAPAKARYLAGLMRLSTLAVHPAYWRRGHAAKLVSWCTRLADLERVPVGISAVPTGAIICAKAGFEQQEVVKVKGAHIPGGSGLGDGHKVVELWVALTPAAIGEELDHAKRSFEQGRSASDEVEVEGKDLLRGSILSAATCAHRLEEGTISFSERQRRSQNQSRVQDVFWSSQY